MVKKELIIQAKSYETKYRSYFLYKYPVEYEGFKADYCYKQLNNKQVILEIDKSNINFENNKVHYRTVCDRDLGDITVVYS